jgi:hypothetical protein
MAGRRRVIFDRDEVHRLRTAGFSWRRIAAHFDRYGIHISWLTFRTGMVGYVPPPETATPKAAPPAARAEQAEQGPRWDFDITNAPPGAPGTPNSSAATTAPPQSPKIGQSPDEVRYTALAQLEREARLHGKDFAALCPDAARELEELAQAYGNCAVPLEPSLEVSKVRRQILMEAVWASLPTAEDATREQMARQRRSEPLTDRVLAQRLHTFGRYRNAE